MGRKPHLTFITQLKIINMNFEITSLAEIMNVVEFTNELDNRNIYWAIEECDNAMDYNEGDCLLRVGDLVYSFSNGELLDVHVIPE